MEPGPASRGHEAPKCGGTNRKGGPCGNAAGYKTDHAGYGNCAFHGGATPNGERHAERVAAEQAVARFGLDLDDTPPDEIMLREIQRSSAMVQHLAGLVNALPADELVSGIAGRDIHHAGKPGGDGQPDMQVHQRERVHPLYVMLERERRTLRELFTAARQAGIEERRVRLAERDGERLFAIFAGMMTAFRLRWELSAAEVAWAQSVIAQQLRMVDGGPPGELAPGIASGIS